MKTLSIISLPCAVFILLAQTSAPITPLTLGKPWTLTFDHDRSNRIDLPTEFSYKIYSNETNLLSYTHFRIVSFNPTNSLTTLEFTLTPFLKRGTNNISVMALDSFDLEDKASSTNVVVKVRDL